MKLKLGLSIITINLYLLMINFSMGTEEQCHTLDYKSDLKMTISQTKVKEKIRYMLSWKQSASNFFRLTSSGSPLKANALSTELCKCVLIRATGLADHPKPTYANFPNVRGVESQITANLADKVVPNINVIVCTNSGSFYQYIIIKSNKGASFFRRIFDLYVLVATPEIGEYQFAVVGILRRMPIDEIEPEKES